MMKNNEKLSVIVPVFNEEKVVKETLEKLRQELQNLHVGFEIIAVNDGSSDASLEILKNIPNITLINNPYNLGYGASLKRALRAASGEWVLITDSDGTYPIDKIPDILEYAGDYDMVVGSRIHQKDAPGRKPAKWILKKLASFLVGKKIPDLNSGMRVFRRDKALEFYDLYPSGFSFTTTITLSFFTHDYTVKYVDIPYYERVGISSIRPKHFFDFLGLVMKLVLYFKPLKMLFTPVAIIFLLGAAKAAKDIVITGKIGNLSLILILFSFQSFIMTLILEIVTRKNIK